MGKQEEKMILIENWMFWMFLIAALCMFASIFVMNKSISSLERDVELNKSVLSDLMNELVLENCDCEECTQESNETKTKTNLVSYNGEEKTLKKWCEELNLNYNTMNSRIKRLGWSVEKAFNTPTQSRKKT
jgi:hypothetical protein